MDRDFAAERAALREEEESVKARTKQLEWDVTKALWGVEVGSLVRDCNHNRVHRITGMKQFFWYPERTPLGSGQPGYIYELPTIKPILYGVRFRRDNTFGDAEWELHGWTKVDDETGHDPVSIQHIEPEPDINSVNA